MNRTLKSIFLGFLLAIFSLITQGQGILKLRDDIKPKDRICFALYTVHNDILKMTAQFYPIKDYEPFSAILQVKHSDKWETIDEARIQYPGYTAHFRVNDWDDSQEKEYRVVHNNAAFYEGIVKQNPVNKDEIVMAAFSCYSLYDRHGGQLPVNDIIDNLKKIKPDLLFFSGDQVYDHSQHYLNWLKFGEAFGDIIRNTPTITIPDDHDIGQGNVWGNGGVKASDRNGAGGGYYMPADYIKEVERAQTSHLPDPYDPTPIAQGIGVYYTGLKWGGISFAIIEDRKFKSGPNRVLKERRAADTRKFDVPEATLLGKRQLDFLEHWTTDWKDAQMKAVLSQTVFADISTHSPSRDKRVHYSFDSNGWPQTGRNKALSVIRKSYSCMIAGDLHLGSVVHHGIEDWNNAGYSFAVPAVANFWLRWWDPETPGKNRKPGAPAYTGEFLDAFHNKMTVHAVANPSHDNNDPKNDLLNGRAAGYGIIRFNKNLRTTTFECWPRNVDMTAAGSKPYAGWPVTFAQTDNFLVKDGYVLPVLEISKPGQVVTVMDNYTSEVVLSLRIKGNKWQPQVLQAGSYKIAVGENEKVYFYDVEAKKNNKEIIKVKLP